MQQLDGDILRTYFSKLQQYEDQQHLIKRHLSQAFMHMAEYRKIRPNIVVGNGKTKVDILVEKDKVTYKLNLDSELKGMAPFTPAVGKLMQTEFIEVIKKCIVLVNLSKSLADIESLAASGTPSIKLD
eukprot:NODE_419_length_8955_cov_0.206527.p4 type:complete len:128 gc:universal NODE_419_length_8955_cov_0.206527:8468-8851(+)